MISNSSNWYEKYRPKHVKDVILPNTYNKFFMDMIDSGECRNLLLYSSTAGTGKSTIAKAICTDLNADYLKINASEERGIDVLRDQLQRYVLTKSLTNKGKIIFLDEADKMSDTLQCALKAFIEQYSKNCRFILACNTVNKINIQLQDRLMPYDFDMRKAEYFNEVKDKIFDRLSKILINEKIQIENEKEILTLFIEKLYPSLRNMIKSLQLYAEMHGKIDEGILKYKVIDDKLIELVLDGKITEARQFISSNNYNYTDVFKKFDESIISKVSRKSEALKSIASWEANASISSMPEIQIAACMIELLECK
jgi:replication factor C small subunit